MHDGTCVFCGGIVVYIFQGIVHPERAQFSLQFSLDFFHPVTKLGGIASASIILNQIHVQVETDSEWNIYDLRNVVLSMVRGQISVYSYVSGLVYIVEIRRVMNSQQGIDYVFGVDMPCVVERNLDIDKAKKYEVLRSLTEGDLGYLIVRCFNDLVSAMRDADDTGFYCYRAIESLLNHYKYEFENDSKSKNDLWSSFRGFAEVNRETITEIKRFADPNRHGGLMNTTSDERRNLLLATWGVVDSYFDKLIKER